MMKHTCHAKCCPKVVHPRMLMCPAHWRTVPGNLQRAVWDTYRDGQERGAAPVTREYLDAAEAGIEAVYQRELAGGLHRNHTGCRRAGAEPAGAQQTFGELVRRGGAK